MLHCLQNFYPQKLMIIKVSSMLSNKKPQWKTTDPQNETAKILKFVDPRKLRT